jgi:biopolymer transport protein ExbD
MDFRRQKKPPLEISMTPMIDVVFLLLIFFMVTTTFNRQTELTINLPEAKGQEAKEKPKTITLMIDADGNYFISDQQGKFHQLINRKLSTLQRALAQAAGDNRLIPVIINADGKTPHQAVISALDVAGRLGFKQVVFATLNVKAKP